MSSTLAGLATATITGERDTRDLLTQLTAFTSFQSIPGRSARSGLNTFSSSYTLSRGLRNARRKVLPILLSQHIALPAEGMLLGNRIKEIWPAAASGSEPARHMAGKRGDIEEGDAIPNNSPPCAHCRRPRTTRAEALPASFSSVPALRFTDPFSASPVDGAQDRVSQLRPLGRIALSHSLSSG